jgi:hypothetical protein
MRRYTLFAMADLLILVALAAAQAPNRSVVMRNAQDQVIGIATLIPTKQGVRIQLDLTTFRRENMPATSTRRRSVTQ